MGSQRYFEKQSPQHQRGDGFYNQTYRSDTVIAVSAGSTAVQSAAVCLRKVDGDKALKGCIQWLVMTLRGRKKVQIDEDMDCHACIVGVVKMALVDTSA
eukprot:1160250-Pelagomonas_calceolata.AAC.3